MKKSITIFSLLLLLCFSNSVKAQDPMIGEIRMFAGNFAPRGWAFCDGQLLAISQNTTLFSLLGTIYGGDGRTTFALPDLRGRAPIHEGQGSGLTYRALGSRFGFETSTINTSNLPYHNHSAAVTNGEVMVVIPSSSDTGNVDDPSGNVLAIGEDAGLQNVKNYRVASDADGYLAPGTGNLMNNSVTVGYTGGQQPFNNMQPVLTVNYIIALEGIYPSRN